MNSTLDATGNAGARMVAWMRRHRRTLALTALLGVVVWAKPMGLLLWARIRILTSIPKTAIADGPQLVALDDPAPADLDTGIPEALTVTRDPFAIDVMAFPSRIDSAETARLPEPIFKPETANVENRGPDGPETARRAAERFRLQSAGEGLSTAVIDGRTYRIGDIIDGFGGASFTLVEVREQSVVLECDGLAYEIGFRGTGIAEGGTRPPRRKP